MINLFSSLKMAFLFFFLKCDRFGWSKRKVPLSRSGRVIKGRGVFVSFFEIECKIVFQHNTE